MLTLKELKKVVKVAGMTCLLYTTNCGRNKAVKSLQELDDEKGIGLIEKRRQGFGKVTIIYVKSFIQEECEEQKKEKPKMVKFTNQTSVEEEETEEVYISNFKKSQKQTSRSPENKLQEVYISNSNNTNINNTNLSENKSCLLYTSWVRNQEKS